jgi:hypothetical protein
MINLIPYAGLGNRLRVVSSVVNFCKKQDVDLKIFWIREPGFNCCFSDIFEPNELLNIDDHSLLNHFLYNRASARNLFIPKILNSLLNRNFYYDLQLDALNSINFSNDVYITTYSQQGDLYPIKELFVPKEDIREKIEVITSQFSSNTYGLHIRRKDNKASIEQSPIELFEKAIDSKLSEEKDARFFLCSDDQEVKKYLKNKYGGIILSYDSVLSRASKQGIKDAVVELWALSLTKEIWGSFYSSYSEMASFINGSILKIMKAHE